MIVKRIRYLSLRSVNHNANDTAGSLLVGHALRTMVRQNNLVGKPTQPNCMFVVKLLDKINQGCRTQMQEAKVWDS